ncbi:MAG: hypothetical protein MH204_05070, partial [Fimbriimonadaceae bacterium]|nr:hypothetical protein [Fimbriimonadaceae bacterium]
MSRPSRVHVVSELYYPEGSSTGRILTRLAEGLAEDREVHALCCRPTYESRGEAVPTTEVHKGVHIRRVASTTFDKNRLVGRAFNALSATASMFLGGLKTFRRGDVVLTVTNPPTMPFVVSAAARLKG